MSPAWALMECKMRRLKGFGQRQENRARSFRPDWNPPRLGGYRREESRHCDAGNSVQLG
ncbi:hypothetical protein M758_10G031300 [Ceratodon purpureus]|nr:hypothetical protein M758_10G031300 [Ceratodon purpureus]